MKQLFLLFSFFILFTEYKSQSNYLWASSYDLSKDIFYDSYTGFPLDVPVSMYLTDSINIKVHFVGMTSDAICNHTFIYDCALPDSICIIPKCFMNKESYYVYERKGICSKCLRHESTYYFYLQHTYEYYLNKLQNK